MANKHETLTDLFSDIADSIRGKTGETGTIVADDFPEAIDAIPQEGGIIKSVSEDFNLTQEGRLSLNKATSVEQDNTKPITAAAVYTEVGNINALLELI